MTLDLTFNLWDVLSMLVGSGIAVGLAFYAVRATRRDDARSRRRQLSDRIAELMRLMIRGARHDEDMRELRTAWESLRLLAISEDHGADAFELVWCIIEAEQAYNRNDLSLEIDRAHVEEGLDVVGARVLKAWVDDPDRFDEVVAAERRAFWEFGQERRTTADKYRRIETDEKLGLSWRMLAGVTRGERRRALAAQRKRHWWSR